MESSPARWDLDGDEIASIASEDLASSRPNRWTGPRSSWRELAEEELVLWRSMQQLRSQDLAAHLYDAFALKRQAKDATTAGLLTVQNVSLISIRLFYLVLNVERD